MNPITIISASAGSGKTYRLAEELKEAVLSGEVRPDAVLATTFTVKAASELRRRVRTHLLATGRRSDAQRLAAARFGTVNAVCGRLVSDFAFELGLSPDLGVLDENAADRTLRAAMSSALTAEDEQRAGRLDFVLDGWDWQAAVRSVVSLARLNGIGPEALASCAERSRDEWRELLGEPSGDAAALDAALLEAVETFLAQHASSGDAYKKTKDAVQILRRAQRLLSGGRPVPWPIWVKLAALDVAVKSRDAARPVIEAAAAHDTHPRLRENAFGAIDLVFGLAARTLEVYQAHKRAHGVIDFVDQETYTLRLLERDDVRQRLGAELDLVMVDEFQDTSPIQLAIFLRLAAIATRSVWVGDQKQAIYGFRGTDPALMDAAIVQILAGADPETLPMNRRSRPGLVRLTSDLFAPAFETVGIPAARVRLAPAHEEEPEGLSAVVECWSLDSKNKPNDALAIADAVSQLLVDDVTVRDPATLAARPVCPGDVAILCRTNDTCTAVAHAIEARGVRVVLPRLGLFATLEGRVALAGLRLWLDAEDALAAAELAYLIEHAADGEAWLNRAVEAPGSEAFAECPSVSKVAAARRAKPGASPVEALDAVIEATQAVELCHRWGSTAPRLANLERFRAHAMSYTESRSAEGAAASTAGLVRHLAGLAGDKLDTQGVSSGGDAVTVSTWHRAKGLEWPVTVLFELDARSADRAALGVQVVSDRPAFDLDDPLADRWIRYWPYPYGRTSKGVPMLNRLSAHPATAAAKERSRREEMRLLYVGWTRARDRLVLAARPGKLTGGSLALLTTDGSEGLTEPQSDEVEWVGHRLEVLRRNGCTVAVTMPAPTSELALPEHEPREHSPAWRLPSAVEQRGSTGDPMTLGERTSVSGTPAWDDLGNAVHSFLVADREGLPAAHRRAMAERLLESWSVTGAIRPADVVAMADRLWAWVDQRWPGARRHREWPLAMRADDGGRWVGAADLVLELDDRVVLIDHKTFPGAPDQAAELAEGYWGQLDAYRRMLEAATGKPVAESYVHFPVLGVVVPLEAEATPGTVNQPSDD